MNFHPPRPKEHRMLTRRHIDEAGQSAVPGRRHAVVVGGSVAGMLAARVLADHFDSVTLLERDHFTETPARFGSRSGVPATPGPGNRGTLAVLSRRGPLLPDHGRAETRVGRSTGRPPHCQSDARCHETAMGPATAGGGVQLAPTSVGARRAGHPRSARMGRAGGRGFRVASSGPRRSTASASQPTASG
jgi:hypothetical protein